MMPSVLPPSSVVKSPASSAAIVVTDVVTPPACTMRRQAASSVRALGASGAPPAAPHELAHHERRAALALGAITAYFVAIAFFVAAGAAIALDHAAHDTLTWLPIGLTLIGMALIVAGVAAMALESRDSASLVAADIARLRERYAGSEAAAG